MQIQNAYLTHNRPKTRRSRTTAIAVHWVANPNSTAMANRNYFNTTSRAVSSNYVIGLQGEILCCIPDEETSWCTNEANSYTVSVECCHPDWTGCFTGKTYTSLVELTARLCQKYHLDPQNGGVIRHYDVTRKICPKWFVPASRGGSDTNDERHWKQFLHDVAQQMQHGSATAASKPALRYDWKQGQAVRLYKTKTQLFANDTATKAAGTLPAGTYYIYDGKQCKLGRYRVTTRKDYCGKRPAGKYVTGYVSVDNFREV